MINVRTFLIAIVLLTTSCYRGDYDSGIEPPTNNPSGDYSYESVSTYLDANGDEEGQKELSGAIRFDPTINATVMYVTPLRGWSYTLVLSSYAGHVLSDNSVVYTYNIILQPVISNYEEFNVQGLRTQELRDPDGTLIGTYDGIIESDGTMKFGFASLDYITDQMTRTTIVAKP